MRHILCQQLDLRDNRKVITDYRNLGITHILTDLVVSSGYLPGVLRGAPSSAVLRKASSCGLGHPWGTAHVVCRGYLGSYPPHTARHFFQINVQCTYTLHSYACFIKYSTKMIIFRCIHAAISGSKFNLF